MEVLFRGTQGGTSSNEKRGVYDSNGFDVNAGNRLQRRRIFWKTIKQKSILRTTSRRWLNFLLENSTTCQIEFDVPIRNHRVQVAHQELRARTNTRKVSGDKKRKPRRQEKTTTRIQRFVHLNKQPREDFLKSPHYRIEGALESTKRHQYIQFLGGKLLNNHSLDSYQHFHRH